MTTPRQQELLDAMNANGGSVPAAAAAIGMEDTNAYRMLRKLRAAEPAPVTELTPVEEHTLVRQNKDLKAQLAEVLQVSAQDKRIADMLASVKQRPITVPKWLGKPKGGKSVDRAIATAFLSDTHFDEVVEPDQINYVNAYNREIAEQRLDRFFRSAIRLSTGFINGIQMEGMVLPLGGDLVSGNIHDELAETNEAHILDTVIHYAGLIVAGIYQLVDQYGKVYAPCVIGNHGRLHRKPRAKYRAIDNFDWLLYKILEREFRQIDEVTIDVSTSSDTRYSVYNTRYQLTHGDQFRGGSGISGMLAPLMLGAHRKHKREAATGTPYDYLVMGHWHQLAHFKGLIVNGSLKGYDEYAAQSNFDFEPPQQAFWLTDPKWGKTLQAPIHVIGKNEYWRSGPKAGARIG